MIPKWRGREGVPPYCIHMAPLVLNKSQTMCIENLFKVKYCVYIVAIWQRGKIAFTNYSVSTINSGYSFFPTDIMHYKIHKCCIIWKFGTLDEQRTVNCFLWEPYSLNINTKLPYFELPVNFPTSHGFKFTKILVAHLQHFPSRKQGLVCDYSLRCWENPEQMINHIKKHTFTLCKAAQNMQKTNKPLFVQSLGYLLLQLLD